MESYLIELWKELDPLRNIWLWVVLAGILIFFYLTFKLWLGIIILMGAITAYRRFNKNQHNH